MDDSNKYKDEDIMQAIALHIMTTAKVYGQLDDEIRNKPYIQYYFEKLNGLKQDMYEDFQNAMLASVGENDEILKFIFGDDGLTEV